MQIYEEPIVMLKYGNEQAYIFFFKKLNASKTAINNKNIINKIQYYSP